MLSRLKGMETSRGSACRIPVPRPFAVLSRLKGMETGVLLEVAPPLSIHFRFAFPFEGNGNNADTAKCQIQFQSFRCAFPFEGNGNHPAVVATDSPRRFRCAFPFEGNGNSIASGFLSMPMYFLSLCFPV